MYFLFFMKKILFVFFYCLISFQSFAIEINQDFLNQFDGIALKTIRKSETLHSKSSQREIYGAKEIANILGEDRKVFDIEIIYLDDNSKTNDLTTAIWYNSRPERKNGDYRLKYKKLNSTLLMKEGDIILLGRIDENKLKLIITEKNSKYASKLLNLLQDSNNQEIPREKDSIYSNTSNLKKYEDLLQTQNDQATNALQMLHDSLDKTKGKANKESIKRN